MSGSKLFEKHDSYRKRLEDLYPGSIYLGSTEKTSGSKKIVLIEYCRRQSNTSEFVSMVDTSFNLEVVFNGFIKILFIAAQLVI
jgi:hypothetical protein